MENFQGSGGTGDSAAFWAIWANKRWFKSSAALYPDLRSFT
jgi:hypothetical protein